VKHMSKCGKMFPEAEHFEFLVKVSLGQVIILAAVQTLPRLHCLGFGHSQFGGWLLVFAGTAGDNGLKLSHLTQFFVVGAECVSMTRRRSHHHLLLHRLLSLRKRHHECIPFLGSWDRAMWMWTSASSAAGCLAGHGSAAPPYSVPTIMIHVSACYCVDASI
jgi:hypothetical protein